MNRPFCKQRYNQFNKPAQDAAIELLQQCGYELLSTEEVYTHDLLMRTPTNKQIKIEVEVSTNWKQQTYPYHDCHVPYRKWKNKAHFYIRFNSTYTSALLVRMSEVHTSPVIEHSNRDMDNESFFSVPREKLTFYKKINNEWTI